MAWDRRRFLRNLGFGAAALGVSGVALNACGDDDDAAPETTCSTGSGDNSPRVAVTRRR